ncbi:MAG: gliding motility-associated ABC transporter substrate-binding protein GldG [Bacteroidales bacterium]
MKKNIIKNSKRFKRSAIIGLVSSLIIVIALNVISSFLFFRIDLTKDKRHSLSPASIELLKQLEDKVYIRVYLAGDNQPADYQLFAKKTQDILQEFRSYSNQIYFEFIDPIEGKTQEEANAIFGEFNKKGLKPIPISKEDAGGYSTHFVVPGAMVAYKTNEYPANLVVADPSGYDWLNYSIQELEYNLISVIRRLMKPQKAKVAFIDGHGELDFYSTSWITWQLQHFYEVERIFINGKINSLRDIELADSAGNSINIKGNKYDALIIAQPTESFSDFDKYIIDQHIMRGGKVLWLVDATTASIDSMQRNPEFFATARDLRLNDLFFSYGVRLNPNLIQDLSCQSIPTEVGRIGDQPQYKFMAFPYTLDVVNFSEHPIVRNMKEIKSDFTGTVDLVGKNDQLKKTILITSSERTKIVPTPSIVSLKVGLAKPNIQEYAFKYLPIAVLVEGTFESAYNGILPVEFDTIKEIGYLSKSQPTRQIFVSDGDIIRNFIDRKYNQPYPAGYDIYTGKMYDNSQFIINCVNYLCADDDLLSIRAKNFKIGSLNPDKIRNEKNKYAIINIVIPLIIILLMGIVLIVLRKMKYSKNRK